jgi:hypothetical protein
LAILDSFPRARLLPAGSLRGDALLVFQSPMNVHQVNKTATAAFAAVAHFELIAMTGSALLASLVAAFAALLPVAVLMAVAVRLFDLSAIALLGFAAHLAGFAGVVAILNHVRATLAFRPRIVRCHKKLLSPCLGAH